MPKEMYNAPATLSQLFDAESLSFVYLQKALEELYVHERTGK